MICSFSVVLQFFANYHDNLICYKGYTLYYWLLYVCCEPLHGILILHYFSVSVVLLYNW